MIMYKMNILIKNKQSLNVRYGKIEKFKLKYKKYGYDLYLWSHLPTFKIKWGFAPTFVESLYRVSWMQGSDLHSSWVVRRVEIHIQMMGCFPKKISHLIFFPNTEEGWAQILKSKDKQVLLSRPRLTPFRSMSYDISVWF